MRATTVGVKAVNVAVGLADNLFRGAGRVGMMNWQASETTQG